MAGQHRGGSVATRHVGRRACADAESPPRRGQPGPVPRERRPGRASALIRSAAHLDRGHPVRVASEVTNRAVVVAALFLASACSTGGTPLAATPTVSPVAALVTGPDAGDQPSFAVRSGRPPALSLQELFHPTFNVPLDPSKIRTLLVTGDIIPARGVNYFATIKHDFLWPFRPTADYTKNADITYINLE